MKLSASDMTNLGRWCIIVGLLVAICVAEQPIVALAGLLLAWLGTHLYARGGRHELR
jgi:hypothetical protein